MLGGAGGVPHQAGGQLGGDEHVGAVVLDRLVHGDRPTELDAHFGVLAGEHGALAGHTDGLGGQDGAGQVEHRPARARQHRGRGTVELDASRPAGRVHVVGDGDAHSTGGDIDDRDIVADRDQDDPGQSTAEHDPCRTVDGAVAQLGVAAEGDSTDR